MELNANTQWYPLQEFKTNTEAKQNLPTRTEFLVRHFQNLHLDFVFDRRQ